MMVNKPAFLPLRKETVRCSVVKNSVYCKSSRKIEKQDVYGVVSLIVFRTTVRATSKDAGEKLRRVAVSLYLLSKKAFPAVNKMEEKRRNAV